MTHDPRPTALITGASGFIGTHLVAALSAEGKAVRALYKNRPPRADLKALPGVEWMRADLLDMYDVEAAFEGVQDVYHCAATVSFRGADRDTMLHNNVEATAAVVNEAVRRGVRKLVHLSSVAALGRPGVARIITEEEPWEESGQATAYGVSKYSAELEAWRGAGEGLAVAVVNPGIVLGEDLRGPSAAGHGEAWNEGSARLFRVVDGEFPFYTEGITGWVDVHDVVRAMTGLMASDVRDERAILSTGNFSYREVFTLMAAALGRRPPRFYAGRLLSGLAWRWGALGAAAGKPTTLTKETARAARSVSCYDGSKISRLLPGFRYTPLEETIQRGAAAYRADHPR